MSYHHPYPSCCTSILWIPTLSFTPRIYKDSWYRGNFIGDNNYEQQVAQLNFEIETKHIAIESSNKYIIKYFEDNLIYI